MKKNLFLLIAILAVINFLPSIAFSYYDAGTLNRDTVTDLRLYEIDKREKITDITKIKKKQVVDENEADTHQEAFSDIKSISFRNNGSISSKVLLKVIKNYIDKPMNVQNVSAIRKELMKYYQSKGYYSAVVMVNSQNTQTGELILDVNEGGRNSITVSPQ